MRLDRDKRYQIKALLSAGLMQKEIAKLLDAKEPTLSREISRNGGRIHYDPEKPIIEQLDWRPQATCITCTMRKTGR